MTGVAELVAGKIVMKFIVKKMSSTSDVSTKMELEVNLVRALNLTEVMV